MAKVSPEERLARAQALARKDNLGDRLPAIDIALSLAEEHQVSDDLVRVVVSFIEQSTLHEAMAKFWLALTPAQRQVFTTAMMARLQDPAEGKDYTRLNLAFIPRPPEGSPLRAKAEAIYRDRYDLKVWQYEAALKLAQDPKSGFGTPAYAEQQRRFLRMLFEDDRRGFAPRALAFLAVHPVRTDEERKEVGRRLDRVPDAQIEEMIRFNWHRTINTTTTTETTLAFRQLALARIERIADEKIRRQAQEWFRNRGD